MNRKLAMLSLALVAISLSAAAPAQAREAYFDQTCCCCDDQDTSLTAILDTIGTQNVPLYNISFSQSTPITNLVVSNKGPAPSRELSFDVTYGGDDTDEPMPNFRTNSVASKSTNGPVTAGAPGAVTVSGSSFSAAFSLTDPLGEVPTVVLTYSGVLSPGLSFDAVSPLERLTDGNAYSLQFNFSLGSTGGSNGQPLFSSFLVSSDIVTAVPEPSTLLLATLGGMATWQIAKPRRRTRPR